MLSGDYGTKDDMQNICTYVSSSCFFDYFLMLLVITYRVYLVHPQSFNKFMFIIDLVTSFSFLVLFVCLYLTCHITHARHSLFAVNQLHATQVGIHESFSSTNHASQLSDLFIKYGSKSPGCYFLYPPLQFVISW